jgi:hypothetical protein
MVGSDKLKARAEAAFRKVSKRASSEAGDRETTMAGDRPASASRPVETTEGAMDEYLARQQAERAKMARLRKMRLAAEAGGPKAKGKPGAGKAKRP